jgi:hypothetical protein
MSIDWPSFAAGVAALAVIEVAAIAIVLLAMLRRFSPMND